MKRTFTIQVIFFLLVQWEVSGQSYLETYTPSSLFEKGAWEINAFHNLYSQSEVRDREGEIIELGQTQTFINALYQFTYGITNSARVNIGLDVTINRAYYDGKSKNPLRAFGASGDFSRTALSAVGPRVKVLPITSLPNFSVQSSVLFPVAENLETPFFTGHDRITWLTQLFYDHKINEFWRVFLEADFLNRFKTNSVQRNFFRVPVSAFLSYFPTGKSTLYTSIQYSPRFETISNSVDEQFGLNQWFTVWGVGAKYQATSNMSLELSYGNFVLSRNDGAGYTINLGIRYIRGG